MPDDTSTTLGALLGVRTWDVVAEVERLAAVAAEAEADRARATELEALISDIAAQGWRHPFLKRARLRLADQVAPRVGRFRSAVLTAYKRGIAWEIVDEEEYLELVGRACAYCGGSTGGGIGLDRLDSKGAYSAANVVPSCGPCNVAQGRGRRLPPRPA